MAGIRAILERSNTIAVVGLSSRPDRPSHQVARYMQAQGYRIVPVNPNLTGPVLGERPYADLESVPGPVHVVNIFRCSETVPPVVDSAIGIGAPVVWMQLGVVHQQAAERARSAGVEVIMDRCIKVEHAALARRGALSTPATSSAQDDLEPLSRRPSL